MKTARRIAAGSLLVVLGALGAAASATARLAARPDGSTERDQALELNQQGLNLFEQGRFDEAARLFDKALRLLPGNEALRKNLGHAHFERGRKYLDAKDPGAARTQFRRAVSASERNDQFHLHLGVAAYQLRDDEEATAAFRRCIELNPLSAAAHENLGHVQYRANRLDDAIAEWSEALRIDPANDPLKGLLEKARRERSVEGKFLRDRVTHFEIAYDGDRDPAVSTQVLALLEDAYYRVGSELSHYPSQPTSVILYSQREFSSVTGSHGWVGGLFDGKIRVPVKRFTEQKESLARTLVHEYTHVVVASLCPPCPTWLNEGLAQLLEGADLAAAEATLREAGEEGIRPFSDLPRSFASISDPLEVKRLYAQSLSFVRWLRDRYGSYALHEILREVAKRGDVAESFRKVFHDSLENLELEWRRMLE
jgi:tetratricopeptide (TPR) repeat protein